MTTRGRTRPASRSYTARLHERTAAPRRRPAPPVWFTRYLPAMLAVGAELGHLAAALTEWPGASPRGLFHVLAAAALGFLAVSVYFGPTRRVPGIALTLALPIAWPAGALAGFSPYRDVPVAAALALAAAELTIAGLLATRRADGYHSGT